MTKKPMLAPRVAFITNVLAHYRVTCFELLAELLRGQITYFFLAETMSHRSYVLSQGRSSVPGVWLPGWSWHLPPNDDKHLNDIRPILKDDYDIIVLGAWDEPTYLLLWLYGVASRKRILFSVETTAYDGPRTRVKEWYKNLLLKHAAGCTVPGKRAFDYCSALGMPRDRIFLAPNATDRRFFSDQAERLKLHRERIRIELGIEGVAILCVARMVEEYKSISTLIEAFEKLVEKGKQVTLLAVGDGPDRPKYERLVEARKISKVFFLRQLNHEQLCRIYSAADIQVLPSQVEPWGFVLNEGMEFGLPLVVSERVGAGPDLVRPGENGFIFPVRDVDGLAAKLELLVEDDSLRLKMGQASKRIVKDFCPEAWAKGMLRAIESVANGQKV